MRVWVVLNCNRRALNFVFKCFIHTVWFKHHFVWNNQFIMKSHRHLLTWHMYYSFSWLVCMEIIICTLSSAHGTVSRRKGCHLNVAKDTEIICGFPIDYPCTLFVSFLYVESVIPVIILHSGLVQQLFTLYSCCDIPQHDSRVWIEFLISLVSPWFYWLGNFYLLRHLYCPLVVTHI